MNSKALSSACASLHVNLSFENQRSQSLDGSFFLTQQLNEERLHVDTAGQEAKILSHSIIK